jgi:putative mycofactocin binding protein MftB
MTSSAAGPATLLPAGDERVDLTEAWSLSPMVALRPEPFGALAYHFGNRRLVFLRRPELVTLLRGLAAAADVREALVSAALPASHWPAYAGALARLAEADVIRRRDAVGGDHVTQGKRERR